jgi:phosphatidylserine/phosphatidylglycerophosphate/cardiolipin synthase-like enzyme
MPMRWPRWALLEQFAAPDRRSAGKGAGHRPARLAAGGVAADAARRAREVAHHDALFRARRRRNARSGRGGLQWREVTIVTNTLAVADHITVHGAYRWYRKTLLAAGVGLYEYYARVPPRAMLHSKALIVDDRRGFIGSFNFDLRSAFLNTEMGVVFDDDRLLTALRAEFDWCRDPDQAFRLVLSGRFVNWMRDNAVRHKMEPGTSAMRRTVSFIIGHLPIHRWL